MAALPTFPIFLNHPNACANCKIREQVDLRSGQNSQVADLGLFHKCVFVPFDYGRLVVSRLQVCGELFQVFREHIHLFGKRSN